MEDETDKPILSKYKHYLADVAIGSNLAPHVRAADKHLAKLAWMNFWDPSHTVQFIINDVVQTPLTRVKPSAAPAEATIGVLWRDRTKAIEIQLPGNLLQIPFFAGLGSPSQIAIITLAHESFHCGQMDRQTKMNVPADMNSYFSQAIHPTLPNEALDLCRALFEAYPDQQAIVANPAVKRLADSALEAQADLAGLMAIQSAYPKDFAVIRNKLVNVRRNAFAADATLYDNADALEFISKRMPASLHEIALATWKWIASEITSKPVLQQILSGKDATIPALALACEKRLSSIVDFQVIVHRMISESARVIGYGKGPA